MKSLTPTFYSTIFYNLNTLIICRPSDASVGEIHNNIQGESPPVKSGEFNPVLPNPFASNLGNRIQHPGARRETLRLYEGERRVSCGLASTFLYTHILLLHYITVWYIGKFVENNCFEYVRFWVFWGREKIKRLCCKELLFEVFSFRFSSNCFFIMTN